MLKRIKYARIYFSLRKVLRQINSAIMLMICGVALIVLLPLFIEKFSANATYPVVDINVVKPISSTPILPDTFSLPGTKTEKLLINACRGEFEPASFVIRSQSNINNVELIVSDLTNGINSIPATAIDLKVVKVWYQGGGAWNSNLTKDRNFEQKLVPELLLNDDSLVKVDSAGKKNYLKLADGTGYRYMWSNPPALVSKNFPKPTKSNFSFADSPSLQPVSLEKAKNKQFWMTIHVPMDAVAGSYQGKIMIKSGGTYLTSLDFQLNVLPFQLAQPEMTYSIYYRGELNPSKAFVYSSYKDIPQMTAELRNMINHGIRNPTVYQDPIVLGPDNFKKMLALRGSLGLGNQPLYLCGLNTAKLENIGAKVKSVQALIKPFGIKDLYIYGRDEAKGRNLTDQRGAWQEIHNNGAKIFAAGYLGTYESMGDLLDLIIFPYKPLASEAAKWHGVQHKIFNYSNPQTPPENPYLWRQNYGVVLWAAGYDGAMPYAYQHCFGSCYNDVDDEIYRDHMFTYPTAHGVIDTIAWEGFREGVDDVRYIQTLENQIVKALKSDDANMIKTANAARQYLRRLKIAASSGNSLVTGILKLDLDSMRYQIISYIKLLNQSTK